MITGRVKHRPVRSQTFSLKGGLNEQVSNAELKPGELIGCSNYIEQDDAYSGYQSVGGYERYDGQTAPSSIALDDATLGAEDDSTREAARTAITTVPDDGAQGDPVQGLHIFDDTLYAFRNYDDTNMKMYKDSAAGWVEVDTSASALTLLASTNKVRSLNYRFSSYDSNGKNMYWVDGVNAPRVFDGTTVSTITHASLPATKPVHIGAWQNRLFLVYPGGHIFFSEVGDPTAWDSSTGLAGEIYIGDDVTAVKEAPGGVLVFFTRSSIKILYYGSTSNDFIFKLDDYSNSTGAIQDTVLNLIGTLFFADDKGFTSMNASPDSGGYASDIIGKNIYKTYIANRENISVGTVDRDTNRYYLFYDNGTAASGGLVFTFFNKKLKGVSKIAFDKRVVSVAEGKYSDGTSKIFFGAHDGYVCQMNKGTSFDGTAISTNFTTSYHHYKTPRNWKQFKRLSFEITAETNTTFTIGGNYDYGGPNLADPTTESKTVTGTGALWGSAIWGSFVWAGADDSIILSTPIYIQGYGRNMAVAVQTTSKYRTQHTVHNISVDYTLGNLQQ